MWSMQEAVAWYRRQGAPADQAALTSLLKEVQQEHGGSIPGYLIAPIAET